jgi:hypothetical protein
MPTGGQDQIRLALAVLTACIARSLGELDPAFGPAFERYLDEAYSHLRETQDGLGALETVAWTRDLVKKL